MENEKTLHSQIDDLYNEPLDSTVNCEASNNLIEFFNLLIETDKQVNKKSEKLES